MLCLPLPQPGQLAPGAPPALPPPWAFHPLIHRVGSGHVGPQLSTGSCRHHWLAGPAPSPPPGRQAAFPQPSSLKPNPSLQLQPERAPGPAFPGDPAACRSHGQGIFPVPCSKPAEPPEQRAGRDSDCLPSFTPPPPAPRQNPGQGSPRGQRDRDYPSWGGPCLGKQSLEELGPDGFGAVHISSSSSLTREKTHLRWP